MRALTEALLPMAQVRAVFDLVLRQGCRFPPMLSGSYLHSAGSWLDLLQKLRPQLAQADPACLLRELARDAEQRRNFLFALFLPHHFGGGFDRYPLQSQWIEAWLKANFGRLKGKIHALDSACGSGEGTYGLAEQIKSAGFGGDSCVVHGSTLEPIELFAAAHAFFPHDLVRERNYRCRVAPLFGPNEGLRLEFYLEDVTSATERGKYQLILCNGLLGGPLLHEPAELSRAIRAFASRLAPGGVLLATDRFHAGWHRRDPVTELNSRMQEHGLTPQDVPEGAAGRKPD
jgi:SAM-dependent methyltransferase